jgi:hypothetical protein
MIDQGAEIASPCGPPDEFQTEQGDFEQVTTAAGPQLGLLPGQLSPFPMRVCQSRVDWFVQASAQGQGG